MTTYRTDHQEAWKNELAIDMNFALTWCVPYHKSHRKKYHKDLLESIQKLCARLAENEDIKEV